MAALLLSSGCVCVWWWWPSSACVRVCDVCVFSRECAGWMLPSVTNVPVWLLAPTPTGGVEERGRLSAERILGLRSFASACFDKPPMGTERVEMRKRQVQVHQEAAASVLHARHRMGETPTNASNACCFCWCCCCSCSCLTVRSEDEAVQRSTCERRTEGPMNCEESLLPTLEDARSWSLSFEKVMKSSAGRGCFRQFLRTEFSEENMMFWMACEELKKETNKTVVEEKVRQIYEDFISILSPKEVSLDSHVRDVINRNMLEPTSHTFEEAQQQIYTLMQRDSYPRFINSAAYTDLLKNLEEPRPEP